MWDGLTMEVLQRPGGELATRPIHFFWVVDCSGSMYGEKIGIVNNTIQECIPEMRSAADNNPNAQLLIRALQFSSGASWITSSPVPVEDYGWEDMDANGLTELGKAFDLLAAQLSIPPMPERALPPVIVLLSDGQPTDDYKKSMEKLKKRPWFRKAVKIAISIGQDADDEVLIEFAGNKELVLQANNATALAKMIKWASTTASMVSAPSSKPMNSVATSVPAAFSSTPAVASGASGAASTPVASTSASALGASVAVSVPADDPFAPANNGAPLVLDMSNIPNPDDFDEGAVW